MNVLAIGAHPDDIEYGCGGMLTKYAEKGHTVYLFIASDGSLGGEPAGSTRRASAGRCSWTGVPCSYEAPAPVFCTSA